MLGWMARQEPGREQRELCRMEKSRDPVHSTHGCPFPESQLVSKSGHDSSGLTHVPILCSVYSTRVTGLKNGGTREDSSVFSLYGFRPLSLLSPLPPRPPTFEFVSGRSSASLATPG